MAPPAMADARVSCPVCRAPVHPIAGRCKHCKADLVKMRGGSTGAGETPVSVPVIGPGGAAAAGPLPLPGGRAGAAMPALGPGPAVAALGPGPNPTAMPALGAGPGPTTMPALGAGAGAAMPALGAGASTAGAAMQALPATPSASVSAPATLAPPLAHATATTARPPRRAGGWSQRWPLAVAVVAAVAILVSLGVLLFGDGDGKRKPVRALGPAPDRMQLEMTPPSRPAPPPSGPPAPGMQPDLPPSAVAPDPPDVDPPDVAAPDDPDVDPPSLVDPFDLQPPAPDPGGSQAAPLPRDPAGLPRVRDMGQFFDAAIDVGCERLLGCLGSSDAAQSMCRQARMMGDQMAGAAAQSCPQFDAAAAQACLGAIARFPCPGNDDIDPMQLAGLLTAVPSCQRMCAP